MDGKNVGRIFVVYTFLGSHTAQMVVKQVCMRALLKARKLAEDQMKIFTCALLNPCPEIIEKAQGRRHFRVLF